LERLRVQLRNVRGVRDQFGLKSGGLRRVEAVGFWNTYKGTHRGTYKGTYKGIYKDIYEDTDTLLHPKQPI